MEGRFVMTPPVAGLIKDIALLNLGRKHPFRITMMVSERCPLKCATCGIWKKENPRTPSLDKIERFFATNSGFSWINLTGGEIFLRPDMDEIFRVIARTQKRLAFLNFPTSGQNEERIVRQIDEGLKAGLEKIAVTISFDGGASSHDRLRGREGAFSRARGTWLALKELAAASQGRLDVIPGLTLSAELLHTSPEPLDDLVRDLGLDGIHQIHLNVAHVSDHYYANASLARLPCDKIRAVLRDARLSRPRNSSVMNMVERAYAGLAGEYVTTQRPPIRCKALAASVFLDAGLDLYPCTIFPQKLGNVEDAGFDLRLMQREAAWQNTRRQIAAGRCPGCWTPCEAYPAMLGSLLRPDLFKIAGSLFRR